MEPSDHAGLIKRLELPEGLEAPTELRHADLYGRAISRVDLDADVAGINASLDLIRHTRRGRWPAGSVTGDDYIDLFWHECE